MGGRVLTLVNTGHGWGSVDPCKHMPLHGWEKLPQIIRGESWGVELDYDSET